MAWLAATPKPDPRTKRAQAANQPLPVSRIETLKAQKIVPAMPPNPAPHIISRLIEIGLTEAAGMGVVPVSWREIEAWCGRTGIDLDPWEAQLIRRLSATYVSEGRKAESENCPPPWRSEVTAAERDTEVQRLSLVLG